MNVLDGSAQRRLTHFTPVGLYQTYLMGMAMVKTLGSSGDAMESDGDDKRVVLYKVITGD